MLREKKLDNPWRKHGNIRYEKRSFEIERERKLLTCSRKY